jgi:inorganic triphosphatase YgiF
LTIEEELTPIEGAGPAAHTEIELKLTGDPKALKAVFASPMLRSRSSSRARTSHLDAVYYDTDDLRLRGEGLALRVRKNGRRFVQTLKATNGGGGAALARGEWEAQLSSPEPDLGALPDGAGAALAGLLGGAGLRPVFRTCVRRQVRRLKMANETDGPSVVEAAFDLGTIESNGHSMPLAELELELIEGKPATLFQLALELDRLTPLHVETSSKAARGYALTSGEPPAWHKAAPLALERDATVDTALEAILRDCLRHWITNEAAAVDGSDPEAIHQLRVAIRRLRSVFSVFGKVISARDLAWLKPEAKRIVTSLGPARDWDVFLGGLLGPVQAARPDDPDLTLLRHAAEDARTEGYATARAAIRDPAYTSFVLRFAEWIETRGWRHDEERCDGESQFERPAVQLADQLLAHRERKALKRGHEFEDLAPPARHELRIALKKLRYTAEFFQSLYSRKRTGKYIEALKHLQDSLGHLNDVAVAERLVDHLLGQPAANERCNALQRAAGLVLGWYAHGAHAIEQEAFKKWTAFVGHKRFWN